MSMRDDLGRWLFQRDYREQGLASPEDAPWELYVERNQNEWKDEADAVLTESPAKSLTEFAQWIVSLDEDDPESPGRKDRQVVTLTKIIERARLALDS